jgi:hypothetical protein
MTALGVVCGSAAGLRGDPPFHDFSIDGPTALSLWGIGAALGFVCFVSKARSLAFGIISLVANVVPPLGAFVVWWLMSQSNFAWN